MLFGMRKMPKSSQEFKKVAECLYRNANKDYYGLVKVNGKQIRRSLKTSDLAIAKRRLIDFRAKAERLEGQENRNIRFDELAVDWLASIQSALKPKSYDRRRVALIGLNPYFKGMPVKSIGFSEIDEWKRKRGASISARSHNIELESLKLLLSYACDRGILLDNTADGFKRRKQPKCVIELLSHLEFQTLVNALRAAPFAVASGADVMVEFLAYSGMRVGEAREVRFRDVNLDLGSVLVTGGALGTKNHQERSIPLFPNLRNLIERIRNHRRECDPGALIFDIVSPRGAMLLACKRAGLKQFSVHSLRHFFASNAIENGINFKVISDWLGHSDGGILVAKTYGHLRAEYSTAMAEKMSFEVPSPPRKTN